MVHVLKARDKKRCTPDVLQMDWMKIASKNVGNRSNYLTIASHGRGYIPDAHGKV